MNFFDAQDRARRASKWLVAVYLFATALIVLGVTAITGFALYGVAGPGFPVDVFVAERTPLLLTVASITASVIFGASLYRTSVLSVGGGRVARQVGGTLVPADAGDALRRRLRNVVEEMAIASGMPVPEIYVLEEESGINAFAAGHTPGDAAIAVTRGALESLDRDELQGVVAHEFSHILNGDMKLNIRLMGVLFGILLLGLIGRIIVRGGHHTSILSSRRDRSAPVILVIGIGIAVLGAVGVFFARLIKAGVSRQREYLADASAVQFTRQNRGIANALKKIGGYAESSYLKAADPEEISHMLFGSGAKLFGWFATHPPLAARIRALDPSFDESDYPRVEPMTRQPQGAYVDADDRVAGLSSAFVSGGRIVSPETIVETVGNPDVEHVEYARRLRAAIPPELYDAAHSGEYAYLLALALILDRSGTALGRQLALIEERLGAERARLIRRFYDDLASTGDEFRLPLQAISFPALKLRPAPQLGFLVDLAARLIEIDGEIDLYEYCFYRILVISLGQAADPLGPGRARHARRRNARRAASELLALVAFAGHDSRVGRDAAYAAGAAVLGGRAEAMRLEARPDQTVAILDRSLDTLRGLDGRGRQRLLRAVTAVANHDRHLTVAEAELIRVVCATLDCPLPPILVTNSPLPA